MLELELLGMSVRRASLSAYLASLYAYLASQPPYWLHLLDPLVRRLALVPRSRLSAFCAGLNQFVHC